MLEESCCAAGHRYRAGVDGRGRAVDVVAGLGKGVKLPTRLLSSGLRSLQGMLHDSAIRTMFVFVASSNDTAEPVSIDVVGRLS